MLRVKSRPPGRKGSRRKDDGLIRGSRLGQGEKGGQSNECDGAGIQNRQRQDSKAESDPRTPSPSLHASPTLTPASAAVDIAWGGAAVQGRFTRMRAQAAPDGSAIDGTGSPVPAASNGAGDPAGEVTREELEEQALPPVSHVRPSCHKRESPQELLVSFLQALAESWPRPSPSELPGSGARLELARLIVFLCDEFRRCFVLDPCHLSPFWCLVLKCGAVFTGAIEAQAGCRSGGDGCEHAGDLSQLARNAYR